MARNNGRPAGGHRPAVRGDSATEPWEQLPDESDPAWQAFRLFRDQRPGQRSIAGVARECSKSRSLIQRWATRYAWQLRAAAYDTELDRQWRQATVVMRRENAERDLRIAHAMLAKVVQRLQTLDAERLTARDVATWLEVATKVSRLALGEPTERTEHTGAGDERDDVYRQMTPEERRARLGQLVREAQRRLHLHLVPNPGE